MEKHKPLMRLGSLCMACMIGMAGCVGVPRAEIPTTVPEVRPGAPAGYLQANAVPTSASLLPPPPTPDSAAFAADEEAYRGTRALRGTPRWSLAAQDAVLGFPVAVESFSCALDAPITQETTPHLYMLLRRSLTDSAIATSSAKDRYKRTRPFVIHGDATCTPEDEEHLRASGSYPSGHAGIGWTWALILSEVAPDRANEVLARGLAFGQSRVICGVHWQNDVAQARVVGAGVVARLHGDPVFRAELGESINEVAAARAKGMKPSRDCRAEAAALE